MTAVGVDSLGWEEYHRRAYRGFGLSVTRENVLGWRRRDRKKNSEKVQKEVGRKTEHGVETTLKNNGGAPKGTRRFFKR
jgi:hypothetical protein